jgi:hypothetical protein
MTMSATHDDKNHMSADVCNSGFRANTLIWIILAAVHMPPADHGDVRRPGVRGVLTKSTHLGKRPTGVE